MPLAFEYWLLAFLAALGVIQSAAVKGGLRGLWFFPNPLTGRVCAILLVLIAFARFFLPMDRNVRGVEGFQQSYLFVTGALSALAVTLALSSWLRRGLGQGKKGERGLAALKDRTYFQALWEGRQKDGG
ncbi:MAG TPA: hypothetical protein VJ565_04095 [Dehalococcoidia bacterium]|nr:hypothetical protein [Dehalococcoidia bacterium]